MSLSKYLEDIITHKTAPIYYETFPMFPVIRFLSYNNRAFAKMLNTTVNNSFWHERSNNTKVSVLQSILPKTRYDARRIFSSYNKAPKVESVHASDESIKWVMTVFDVSSARAAEYLENANFSDAVDSIMNN